MCHIPSVLGAQPHRALIGFWVNAEEVLQTGPSERTPGGAAHGPAIHRAVCMNAVSSTHPQHPRSSIGAGNWELLLLLTTGGLSYHVFGALTFIICVGRKYECVCVCVSGKCVCVYLFILTYCHSWMIWWSDWPDSAEWTTDWENPHHRCHRCQTDQARPSILIKIILHISHLESYIQVGFNLIHS